MTVQLKNLGLCKLKPFPHHPYKVQDDEEMEALIESIRINGIMTPLLVRNISNYTANYSVRRNGWRCLKRERYQASKRIR